MVYQALPPPPQVKRWTADGHPTQAQVEYENREGIYKRTVEEKIGDNSASIQELFDAQATVDGALSVQWSIVGNINGVTGGLTLTGIKQADGTGATYNLEIDSNVTINGNLLVNGTVTTPKIVNNGVTNEKIDGLAVSNNKIASNAVSNSAFGVASNTPSTPVSVSINLRAGSRVSILATYDGGDGFGFVPSTGQLIANVNGSSFANNSITIRPIGNGIGITQALVSGVLVLTSAFQQYVSGATTLLTFYTAPADGSYTISAYTSSGFVQNVNLLVMELSK